MEPNKTIIRDPDGDFIIIYAEYFDECIQFAQQNKLPKIQLKNAFAVDGVVSVDFQKLELLSEHLRIISFRDTLEGIINPEYVYALKNLETIYTEKQKFALDISKFEKLNHFGGEYWSKLMGIDRAYPLTSAVFRKLPDTNLERLSALKNMESLDVYSSKIHSLNGIQNLPIKQLRLSRNNMLEDIEAIRHLKSLQRLDIEKCKLISDHEIVEELKSKIKVFVIK